MARSPKPPQYYAVAYTSYPFSSSAVASYVVATLFLLLAADGAMTTLFLFLSFAFGNSIIALTFQQLASVRNPNCASLVHYDSSIHVACANGKVGSMYIPAGQIDKGRTQYMAISFTVLVFAISSSTRWRPSSSSPLAPLQK